MHRISLTAVSAGLLVATAAQAETELTVYTAVEAEDLKRYAETFNQDHPDIKINWVRDSTGVVTAKLLAEKNNPRLPPGPRSRRPAGCSSRPASSRPSSWPRRTTRRPT